MRCIYRNLIDLRRPIAGNRPRPKGDRARSRRSGRLTADGPGATAGVELLDPLRERDTFYVAGSPSVGACRGENRLQLGVDGRRRFPRVD